jgi:hypothetical protein
MKFSVAQLDLLKSYLTDIQIEEIKAFDPKNQQPVKERCIVTRKNGSQCSNFKKSGDFCNIHKEKEDIPIENQCSSSSEPKNQQPVKERCIVTRKNGSQCSNFKKSGDFCNLHKEKEDIPTENQCSYVKKTGEKCSLKIKESGLCYRHLKSQEVPREPISQEFVSDEN